MLVRRSSSLPWQRRAAPRRGIALLVTVTCLGLLAFPACLGSESSSPGPGASTRPIATAPATVASPTTVVSGAYLEIDGAPVLGVLVPDPGLGAEYAYTATGLYRQLDQKTWQRQSDHDPRQALVVDPLDHNTLYRGDHPPCDRVSTPAAPAIPFGVSHDGGRTWLTLDAGRGVRPLLARSDAPGVVFGDRCGLAVSSDGGASWRDLDIEPGFSLVSLALSGDHLYGVYQSPRGVSRLSLTNLSDDDTPLVGRVLLEFWGPGVVTVVRGQLLVGELRGVQISRDGGRTWSLVRRGLEPATIAVDGLIEPIPGDEEPLDAGVLALASQPKHDRRIFAGTARGLYLSDSGGQSWGFLSELGEIPVTGLVFGFDGGQLYVTTDKGVAILPNP